jgi:hypothetical protein
MVLPLVVAPVVIDGLLWAGATLGIIGTAHVVLPGREQREQDLRNLGNAMTMSNAQDDAKSNADSGTVAATCATGECPPTPECKTIFDNIKKLVKELSDRRGDMLADRPVSQGGLGMYELFLKDPIAKVPDPRGIRDNLGNWQGHRDQIIEKKRSLEREIKKHEKEKCKTLPNGTETARKLDPPDHPFNY